MPSAVDEAVQARIAAARSRIARTAADRARRTAARRAGVDARNRRKLATLATREQAARQNGSPTMAKPLPTKAECCAEASRLLSRALTRLVHAEADGTLTPAEARVMAQIRARQDAQQPTTASTPSREECIANLRVAAAAVLTRLAVAEAAGRLTEREAAVVARMRSRQQPPTVIPREQAPAEAPMAAALITREQACAAARVVLDRARARRLADEAAGRLSPEAPGAVARLRTVQTTTDPQEDDRA